MTVTHPAPSPLKSQPWLVRALRAIARFTARAVGIFILLAAALVLIAQTDFFQSWVRENGLAILDRNLNGTVVVDDIRLDLFRGIEIVRPRLFAGGTRLLSADRIAITYDLSTLFARVATISEVIIENPDVRIETLSDGSWNLEHVLKPVLDTTTSEPPRGTLVVRHIKVSNGKVLVHNKSVPWPENAEHFDPTHLSLAELFLDASLRLNLADHDAVLDIDRLQVVDKEDGRLSLRAFQAIIRASKQGLEVPKLLVSTPTSTIEVYAAMKGFDVFTGFADSTFRVHPLVARIEAPDFNAPDLHYFVPEVDLLDAYRVYAMVKYDGNSVEVTNLTIQGGPNKISGNVFVGELNGEKPLYLNIAVYHSAGNYADVRRRLRFVPLPDLPFLLQTQIDTVLLRGHPDDSLWIAIHANDRPGRVDGEVSLILSDPLLGYHADFRVSGADMSVFADSTLTSTSLNGAIQLNGRGLTLQTIKATVGLRLDPSVILGRQVRMVKFDATTSGSGQIRVDTLFANLTPFINDTTSPKSNRSEETVSVRGDINIEDLRQPAYHLSVQTSNVNLTRLLGQVNLPTELSLEADVDAKGIELDSIQGRLQGSVTELTLDDRAMMPFNVSATVERGQTERKIDVETDFAEVHAYGRFVPSELLTAVGGTISGIADVVTDFKRHLTSTKSDEASPLPSAVNPYSISYNINVTDVSVLNMFIPDARLSGALLAQGIMSANADSLTVGIDTLVARNVNVTSDSLLLDIDTVRMALGCTVVDLHAKPRVTSAFANCIVDSVLTINSSVLTNTKIELEHRNRELSVFASSGLNSLALMVDGTIRSVPDAAVIEIDSATFVLDEKRGLRWQLEHPAKASLASGVLNIEEFTFRRQWAEAIRVTGIVSETMFNGATVFVENFPLTDIPKFVPIDEKHPVRLLGGLVTSAKLVVNGTWNQPDITANVEVKDIAYNNSNIGTLTSAIRHQNGIVKGTATIVDETHTSSVPALDVRINSVPVNLAFTTVSERIIKNLPWDIALEAHNLNLALAEPFLPAVERVHGRVNAKLALQGPDFANVTLNGAAQYRDGSFLSSSTNISYLSEGSISLQGNTLNLDTVVVRNMTDDYRGGQALATGNVTFNGLSAESVDFKIITQTKRGLLVLNSSSQARSPVVYGDLVIASGTDPIRMYGKLDAPKLSGDVMVLYSDITFPRERSTTKARATTFDYVRHNSSSDVRSVADYARGTQNRTKPKADTNAKSDVLTQTKEAINKVVQAGTASFSDNIDYNLNIYLRGRTLLTMVLSPFEILVADLELVELNNPLKFTGKFADNSTNLKGSVRLKEGTSTYKFYKPFQTGGTLNFSTGGMTNPDLNLIATYQNRRIVNEKPEDYKVQLKITGTKEKPHITYRLWRNEREVVGDSSKIASDALMLILVGKTTDDMMASGQGDIAGQVNAAFSSVATSALSDVISGVGFVQNAQIDLGSDISQSRITLSGQLYGDITYRVSGQISDFSGNSTFTVSVPLSVLGDKEALRLFQTDFSHTVNNTGNITRQTRLWEIKFGARLP